MVSPFFSAFFIYRYYKLIECKNEKIFTRYGSLFEEFKHDKGLLPLMFHPYFFLRRISYIFILYNLASVPLLQVVFNCIHTVGLIVYLWICRPFKKHKVNTFNLIQEVFVLLVFALTSAFLVDLDEKASLIVEYTVISITAGSIFLGYCYSIVDGIKGIRKYFRKGKKSSVKSTRSVTPMTKYIIEKEAGKDNNESPLNNSACDEVLVPNFADRNYLSFTRLSVPRQIEPSSSD